MNENWTGDIASRAGCTPDQVRQVVTHALRLLHEAAHFDKTCNRDILECRFQFGAEACYPLGGIIYEWEDDVNPIILETLQRFPGTDMGAINAKWLEEAKGREVRYR